MNVGRIGFPSNGSTVAVWQAVTTTGGDSPEVMSSVVQMSTRPRGGEAYLATYRP